MIHSQGEDGKHKSEENLELLLEDTVAKFKPNIIVVETFANKISNLDETMSEEDMLIEMKGKVSVLMKLLKKVKGNDPKIKMVVLKASEEI